MEPKDYYNKWYCMGGEKNPTSLTSVVEVRPEGKNLRVKLGSGVSYLETPDNSEIAGDGWRPWTTAP